MNRLALSIACAASLAATLPAAAQEQPPAPGPLRPFNVPTVRESRLPNGVRVVTVEQRSMPIVTGRIMVTAGSLYEPAEKNGLASLTGLLLDEGTASMTGPQIAERMEDLGAQFSTSAGYGTAIASVTALKSAFPDAMMVAAKTVTEPSFPQAEFDRVRNEAVAAYVRSQSSVEGLAAAAFSRAIYDPATAYSRPAAGTRSTLASLTRDDVVQWHRRMYSPANTTVLLVGNVTPEEGARIAARAFGSWTATRAEVPVVRPMPRAVTGTRIILVDRPGSVQSGVYVGQAALGATDPDVIPFTALSQVLGGGFKARVNMNLREQHGWTYGAFSGLNPLQGTGTFAISSSVRTNATDSAVVAAVGEYRRIATEAVPDAELRNSLANLVGSFPNSVQTVQGLAGRMQTVLQYGLPLDYYNTYRERISGVTPAEVSRIGRERLTPSAVTVVVAGDLSKIEAPLRALNMGTVEVWDAEGNKVR